MVTEWNNVTYLWIDAELVEERLILDGTQAEIPSHHVEELCDPVLIADI